MTKVTKICPISLFHASINRQIYLRKEEYQMKILYIDVDSLRPDHLVDYGNSYYIAYRLIENKKHRIPMLFYYFVPIKFWKASQHFLYFLPLPQIHRSFLVGSFNPVFIYSCSQRFLMFSATISILS